MLSSEQLTKLATVLGGLPVLGCRPGSPAARAGIRYGDVVLSVNGMKTPDWASYVEARALARQRMQVAIFRGGQEVELELAFDVNAVHDHAGWLAYLSGNDELE